MKLSVITINYNNCEGLKKTVESVLKQTWTDYEYIIIDGGSNDGSREVIEGIKDHLAYWCSEPDKGIYNAMNKGVLQAHGEYVIFMNSGDCLHNENTLKEVFEGKEYEEEILIGQVSCVGTESIVNQLKVENGEVNFMRLKHGFNHQGIFINLDLQKKHLYDENLKIVSDFKFFLQSIFVDRKKICNLKQIVADYDMTGISSSSEFRDINLGERRQVLESVIGSQLYSVVQELDDIQHSIYYLRLKYLREHSPRLYGIARSLLGLLVKMAGGNNKKVTGR